jgi:hypothetical protein
LEASSLVAVLLEAFQVEDHVLMEEACQGACLEGGCLEGSQEEEDQEEVLLVLLVVGQEVEYQLEASLDKAEELPLQLPL